MRSHPVSLRCALGLGALAALSLSACGGGATPRKLSLSVGDSGKTARFTAPASDKGGLVTVSLYNTGKAPHAAQFALIRGNHTSAQAVQNIESNSDKTPSWLRAEGGVGEVAPGQQGKATVKLPPGKYVVTDLPGGSSGNGPLGNTDLRVSSGSSGSLPGTKTTVTAANPRKDHYTWKISGSLRTGVNAVTFDSKGSKALHLMAAFRVTGNPSRAQIIKALKSNGPPPFADQSTFYNTAALDGGKSQVTQLRLAKPGRYVLFCPLTDRNGGKPHFEEGLLTTINVR